MPDIETNEYKEEPSSAASPEAGSDIRQEVKEIKEAVNEAVTETSLADKVEELRTLIDNISEDVQSWRAFRRDTYVEALETLKSQLDEIQSEWNAVSDSMKTQRERLESLLQSFPGIIDTATLRALSLRVTHLEKLVTELVQESQAKSTAVGTRKQFTISLVALGVTVVLWVIWIVLALIK